MWMYECDVNSALKKTSKEPSSSLMSADASFDDDSNKEALNINKILLVIVANKMGDKLFSNITCPNPTERAAENIGGWRHY